MLRWRDTPWGNSVLLPVHDEIIAMVPEQDGTKMLPEPERHPADGAATAAQLGTAVNAATAALVADVCLVFIRDDSSGWPRRRTCRGCRQISAKPGAPMVGLRRVASLGYSSSCI